MMKEIFVSSQFNIEKKNPHCFKEIFWHKKCQEGKRTSNTFEGEQKRPPTITVVVLLNPLIRFRE